MAHRIDEITQCSIRLSDGTIIKSIYGDVDWVAEARKAAAEALLTGKASTTSLLGRIYEQQVKDAMLNPNGKPAQRIMKEAEKILKNAAVLEMSSDINEQKVYKIWKTLSLKQRDFIFDMFKRKAIISARRSGKTYAIAALLWIIYLKSPESYIRNCLYIERSMTKASRELWDALRKIGDIIDEDPINKGGEYVLLGDSMRIWFGGYLSRDDVERWRGKELSIIILDEVQSAKSQIIEDMCTKVLFLTMATYNKKYNFYDTCFIFSGTPDYQGAGFFIRKYFADPEWKRYNWTLLDNPSIKDPLAFVEDYLKMSQIHYTVDPDKTGLDYFVCDDIRYKREILGDVDAVDQNLTVFPTLHVISTLPAWTPDVELLLGIDVGFTDESAITLIATDWDTSTETLELRTGRKLYSKKNIWVIETIHGKGWSSNNLKDNISTIVMKAQSIYRQYGKIAPIRCYIDHNGLATAKDANKEALNLDLNFLDTGTAHRGQYIVLPALKTHKAGMLYNMADYMSASRLLFFNPAARLVKDLQESKWLKDNDTILPELDDKQYSEGHGDCLHSLLYAFNAAYARFYGAEADGKADEIRMAELPMSNFERYEYDKQNRR